VSDVAAAPGFLRGIVVLELGDGVAGGAAGSVLASLGADVSSVRRADAPIHSLRPPAPGDAGESMLSVLLSAGKKTVRDAGLDPRGFDVVFDDRCDMATADQAAANFETFASKDDPGVWVTVTPFGLSGPKRGWAASDLIVAAASGLISGVRDPVTSRPVQMAGQQAYLSAGHVAALAACHGLDTSRREGRPVQVDLSAQEAALATGPVLAVARAAMNCLSGGGASRNGAPAGLFRCRDGLVHIMALESHQWQALTGVLGSPSWALQFSDVKQRITGSGELSDHLEAELSTWGRAEAEQRLQAAGVPATALRGPADLIDLDQFAVREAVRSVEHNGVAVRALADPYRVTHPPASNERPPLGIGGLRVAEVGHVLAVPLAGALLGGMGANVLKVEDPERLDMYRREGPYIDNVARPEWSAYFAFMNHSKRSVELRMTDTSRLTSLLGQADVVVENLGPQRARRVHVDAATQLERYPMSLAVSSSGYGHVGPRSTYRVYAYNVHTSCGLSYLSRTPAGAPPIIDMAWADLISGYALATVIAAWAIGGSARGGAAVDFSMVELAAGRFNEYLAAASVDAGRGDGVASDHGGPCWPSGVYRTAIDGRWLALSVRSEVEWLALKRVLRDAAGPGARELAATTSAAGQAAELGRTLDDVLSQCDPDDLEQSLQHCGVAAAIVADAELLVSDPHLLQRGFFATVEHPFWGRRNVIGLPWRFTDRPRSDLGTPPLFGSAEPTF
jgi:crotonobetainyl-CoA:carnitine CoA-transferase CaiB-like acyl-CoA transferase